jgi:hypothetical protein
MITNLIPINNKKQGDKTPAKITALSAKQIPATKK